MHSQPHEVVYSILPSTVDQQVCNTHEKFRVAMGPQCMIGHNTFIFTRNVVCPPAFSLILRIKIRWHCITHENISVVAYHTMWPHAVLLYNCNDNNSSLLKFNIVAFRLNCVNFTK